MSAPVAWSTLCPCGVVVDLRWYLTLYDMPFSRPVRTSDGSEPKSHAAEGHLGGEVHRLA